MYRTINYLPVLFCIELLENMDLRPPSYLGSEKKIMDSAQNASSAAGTGGSGGNGSVINDTSASTTVDDSKQNLNQVINSIQKTLGILHQLNLTVSNFNAAYQLPLLQRLYVQFCFI